MGPQPGQDRAAPIETRIDSSRRIEGRGDRGADLGPGRGLAGREAGADEVDDRGGDRDRDEGDPARRRSR
jgi:hypothetical protein